MRVARAGLFPLVGALALTGAVRAAHITDKLAVGLYDSPGDGTPGRVLTSGTPLEVLDRRDRHCRVRLGDGVSGWLECRYVTDEKPARVMLLETQARAGRLRERLEGLKRQLDAKQLRLQELELRLRAARHIIAEQGGDPREPQTGVSPDVAAGDESAGPRGDARQPWHGGGLLPLLLGAAGGFLVGALLLFWRCRRRFGGLRI